MPEVALSVSTAICAHVDRQQQAQDLAYILGCPIAWDDGTIGSNANHDVAWSTAHKAATRGNRDWCIVIEDDAQLIPDFERILNDTLQQVPEQGICSLYTGTSRPPQYQHRVAQAHSLATLGQATFLRHDYLLWGVAVAIRTEQVPVMLQHVQRHPKLPYDYRIGKWMRAYGMHCYYTTPSLVDHEDGPTLIAHPDGQPRTQPRKAWSVGVPPMSGLYVDI